MDAAQGGSIRTKDWGSAAHCSVGLPRFELGTFGPPDHRNLSRTSVWTAGARGFRAVCLAGTAPSVWWPAFCTMRCTTRRANEKDLVRLFWRFPKSYCAPSGSASPFPAGLGHLGHRSRSGRNVLPTRQQPTQQDDTARGRQAGLPGSAKPVQHSRGTERSSAVGGALLLGDGVGVRLRRQ